MGRVIVDLLPVSPVGGSGRNGIEIILSTNEHRTTNTEVLRGGSPASSWERDIYINIYHSTVCTASALRLRESEVGSTSSIYRPIGRNISEVAPPRLPPRDPC